MSTTLAKPVSRPWRRFLRFSVRGLIVLVLVFAIGLGWLVRAQIQHEAVAAITNAGGSVTYGWEVKNRKPLRGANPWAPKWLVDLIGVDYFGHVTAVEFPASSNPTDAVFTHLADLTRLEDLFVYAPSLTDGHLARLEGLTYLNVLVIGDTQVTDAGLVHLSGLTSLSYLSLANTHVTDRGMKHLNGLSLWSLDVSGTEVTDVGLDELARMTSLKGLALADTKVTDTGLAHLKGMKNLSQLHLRDTQVTDAGLAHLTGLTNLSYIDLGGSKVSDPGLEHLSRLNNLSWVRLTPLRLEIRGCFTCGGSPSLGDSTLSTQKSPTRE